MNISKYSWQINFLQQKCSESMHDWAPPTTWQKKKEKKIKLDNIEASIFFF